MDRYSENIIINKQDVVDGEILDTEVELTGVFSIEGKYLESFKNELEDLIWKFRI